jgi:hypothetical protein
MLVVRMPTLVLDRFMLVLVGMALGQMQPHARGHESPRQRKLSRWRFSPQRDRGGAEEGRRRETSVRARRTETRKAMTNETRLAP